MSVAFRCTAAIIALSAALAPASAEDARTGGPAQSGGPAGGTEIWASTDSDHTDVVKLLGRALWNFDGRDKYQGIAVERAWFRPGGQHTRRQTRVYLDFADALNSKWRWQARIGTNGHTVLGNASLRSADWSKELFVEREVVETPRGLDHGIYYTFAGASMDLPAGKRDVFSVMAGVQEFTGRNVRLHLRGNYVHVLKPALGLSVQLRARYFHSTVPGEFDYYSPRNFAQLVPVVQLRRFDRSGWMYLAALGYGFQKATGSGLQNARLVDLRIESPARSRRLQAFAALQYSNNSLTGGAGNYHYVLARAGLTARLR
jgi:hypothetical protein